jgi:hypothetical protein
MGNAECPPHIERAHEIKDAMNEKGGSRDLNDEDIVDNDNDAIVISSDDEKENDPPADCPVAHARKPAVKAEPGSLGPVAQRPLSDQLSVAPRRAACAVTQDFLTNISGVLDPAAQAARTKD